MSIDRRPKFLLNDWCSKNRLCRKHWFITIPKCETEREEILENTKKLNTKHTLTGWLIAREKHSDQSHHIHALLSFSKAINLTNERFFDCLGDKHPNIQAPRNLQAVIKYLMKEDPTPLMGGSLLSKASSSSPDQTKSKGSKSDEISEEIVEGAKFQTILDKYPGFALLHKDKIEKLVCHVESQKSLQSLVPWEPLVYTGQQANTSILVEWVNTNVFRNRAFKSEQLFLYGSTNFRKTSFVRYLSPRCRIYWAPHEDYFDGYSDDLYDLICFDEFRAKDRPVSTLNTLLDGNNLRLKQRYMQTEKKKNLPCIILSNYTLEQLYEKSATHIPLLRSRLLEVILTEPIEMEKISYFEK